MANMSAPVGGAYGLITLQENPHNAAPPKISGSFLTDLSQLFIRFNHAKQPLDPQNYFLSLHMPGGGINLTLKDLEKFQPVSYVSVFQCTGHRRPEFNAIAQTEGIQWPNAVANVNVNGYRLWDVLRSRGIHAEAGKYLIAEQLDEEGGTLFSSCIPLHLVPEDTLLATALNDEPLDQDHGGPVRLFVPNWNAHFSVKDLRRIKIVSGDSVQIDPKHESLGEWAVAIALSKNLVPYIGYQGDKPFFDPELRVNSLAFANPEGVAVAPDAKEVSVKGFAWGGKGGIQSLQVSGDGETWVEGIVHFSPNHKYAWTRWTATLPITEATDRVWIRARDSAGNVQPKQADWSKRGTRNNSWTVVQIKR